MRLAFAVIGLACFVGCDLSRSTAGSGGEKSGSQLSGVIPIPDSFRGEPDEFCSGLDLIAKVGGTPVGRPSLHAQGTECRYELNQLPLNTDVSVSVSRQALLSCMGGSLISLQPSDILLNLKQGETRTANFQANCG